MVRHRTSVTGDVLEEGQRPPRTPRFVPNLLQLRTRDGIEIQNPFGFEQQIVTDVVNSIMDVAPGSGTQLSSPASFVTAESTQPTASSASDPCIPCGSRDQV